MSSTLLVNEIKPEATLSINGQLDLGSLQDLESIINILIQKSAAAVPTGTVIPFAGPLENVPPGWLLCDGESYLRTEKSDLFLAIGTVWGAVNGDEFNVPDFRGYFLRGLDESGTVDPETGRTAGSYQEDDFKSHVHGIKNNYNYGIAGWGTDYNGSGGVIERNGNMEPVGGDETRPKNAAVHYIIKY